MKANYGIIMVIAIFFVVSITFVTAFPSENDDQPTFTLRELMDVLNDKRCTHSDVIYNAAATQSMYRLNKKRNSRVTSYEYSFPPMSFFLRCTMILYVEQGK
jgi:hypothetical protein